MRPPTIEHDFRDFQEWPMESQAVQCPYCGQQLDIVVDPSVPRQEYIEDCQVCCRPITLTVTIHEGVSPRVEARTDDG